MVVDDAMGLISENDLVKLNVGTPPPIAALLDQRDRELGVLAPGCTPLVETPREAGEQEIEIFIGDPFRPSQDAKRSTYLSTTFMLGLKAFDTGRPEARIPDVNLVPCSAPTTLVMSISGQRTGCAAVQDHDRVHRPDDDAGPRQRVVTRLRVRGIHLERHPCTRPRDVASADR